MPNKIVSRRAFSKAAAAMAGLGSLRGFAPAKEGPATHNWMLVGSETAFLSHLPMFEALNKQGTEYLTPHRFQVIAQASFESAGADVTGLYFADRKAHPETKMFTVAPSARFVLPQLAAAKPLTSFKAAVVNGHFERHGREIPKLEDVTVRVGKVVHFHKFDPAAAAPETLQYLLFGRGKELFLAHLIVKPPSFDQILSVQIEGLEAADEQLSRAQTIGSPDRKDTPAERLKEGEKFSAQLPNGERVQIRAVREFYFEEGELLMPATFDPTAEEEKAGFDKS